jgi:hypothetical protein
LDSTALMAALLVGLAASSMIHSRDFTRAHR